ncbi:MAG: proline dehydrogenase family protein [Bdellovibrionaceae bacterium]|nr:proline dehydrogenase family protein [Pseudobdellovibrionaceae bacterium]
MSKNLEQLIFEKGSELLKQSQKHESVFLEKNWWYKKMLLWTMKNKDLKTSLFRFIDVLPSLSSDEQFLSHFNEYFKDQKMSFISSGLNKMFPSLMVKNIKQQITQVAKMFITGSDISSALKTLSKNWNKGLAFSMDILGEATLSEKEAEFYNQAYLDMINQLLSVQKTWSKKEQLEKDLFGEIPKINISVKASSLFSQIKPEAWEYSKKHLKNKLRPLFQKAVEAFLFINLDMEQYKFKTLFLETFKELLMEKELKNYPHFGIVIQAYLKDSFEDLKQLEEFSNKRGQKLTVRLVKGAYWDSEVLLAKQKNWPIPVWTKKEETDANFENCLSFLFEESQNIKIAVGSHNIRSVACALAYHQKYPDKSLEFQVLYGMAEGLAHSLKEKDYLVRLYCTVGDLIPGMSYLVRRLLENSANQSFILNSFIKNQTPEKLLMAPKRKKLTKELKTTQNSFSNFPVLDFNIKENRKKFQQALDDWKDKFPLEVPLVLKGLEEKSSQIFERENPSRISQIISQNYFSDKNQAEKAITIANDFFKEWKEWKAEDRIFCLKKLSKLMEKKLFELSALQVFEVGKTWSEAVADVTEAIDFCNYYANSYEKIAIYQLTDKISGEESFFRYEAVGPTAVIAPWNFPLAILTGMTVAPLVCGNTIIIKPAEQSSLIAFELVKLLLASGFPKESFSFLPGKGEEVGDYLVKHPKISLISFTGSFEVGAQIIKKASPISKRQKDIKKCVVEMGGKNAIIVDSSADLDEAVSGVLQSAFGFQGQKCSACSRLIILEDIYEKFIERFLPAVESLVVVNPEDPSASLGPLIDKDSFERIKKFIKNEKSLKLSHHSFKDSSYFIYPFVYLSERLDSDLMQEELFAPILTCYKVKNLNSAIKALNQTKFGLTAGFYSRHPEHIKKVKLLAEVGNLYINRNCTGAMVKRHPFGGIKMSGLGSKTGAEDYIKQFLNPKITTENNMRRGFSPELF